MIKSEVLFVLAFLPIWPFLCTFVVVILLVPYLISRFAESVSGDISYGKFCGPLGDFLGNCIVLASTINVIVGWEFWLVVTQIVHASTTKHVIILKLEAVKWVPLLIIFSALLFIVMLPRLTLQLYRYYQLDDKPENVPSLMYGLVGAVERGLFLLTELAILWYVPQWKHHMAFGIHTWKLVQIVFLFSLGSILVFKIPCQLLVMAIEVLFKESKYAVYFAKGLVNSFTSFLISTSFMLFWLFYVHSYIKLETLLSNRTLDLVRWGVICLAIRSALWLIKASIVLLWTAFAVYNRFHHKIFNASQQYYLLCILGDDEAFHQQTSAGATTSKLFKEQKNPSVTDKSRAKHILVQKDQPGLTIYELMQMTNYFQNIEAVLKKQDDVVIATNSENHLNDSEKNKLSSIVKETYNRELIDGDLELLHSLIKKQVQEGNAAQKFKTWKVQAYKNVWVLGNTILGAQEVAKYLDKLLAGIILVLTILIWLLATKVATTKLLFFLLSPILAATFIFGETCKNIFQGIIFAYLMHLFDVGDVCIIDGNQMVVERIGIWRTTFVKVKTDEKIMYRNAILIDKIITKYEGDSYFNDFVEYSIPFHALSSSILKKLKDTIDKYLCENVAKYEKHPLGVLVKEIGENVKIVVHFKHKHGDQDMLYSECYKKQRKIRAKLLMKVKDIVDEQLGVNIEGV